ncbi:hypothetical protein F2P81_009529 [Scophthalmus maximus]|uniref:Type I cytokine receptor cytokine-binding domain-containing protein n=1 Tax=Scophthalmus maximus TaxID=52904 RepID=A0A6A4T1U0_SCOMX|nr:hypothetical protein F2P81_009529 [Scophthalmus maximus]
MLRNVALLVFGRLLLAVDSRAGQVLPPQNMSLLWMNDFEPEVTWAPPQHSVANCTYQVFKKTTKRDNDYDLPSPPWKSVVVMEGGFLQVSVKTVCGGKRSEPTVLNVTYPEMVKNVQCYILSSKHAHCSWESANPTAVVHFFYRLVEENLSTSVHDDSPSPRLRECPMSNYKERAGTGCVLQVTLKQGILIVFNGTVNKVPFRNTFRRMPLDHVKPPPLNWTVIKTGKRFLISWIPPDIKPLFGKYIINYTECDKIKIKTIANVEETSAELALLPHCQYRIAMKAQYETFSTPWGDEEHFGTRIISSPNCHNLGTFSAIFLKTITSVNGVRAKSELGLSVKYKFPMTLLRWYIFIFWRTIILAVVYIWLLYKWDCKALNIPRKEILNWRLFQAQLTSSLILVNTTVNTPKRTTFFRQWQPSNTDSAIKEPFDCSEETVLS